MAATLLRSSAHETLYFLITVLAAVGVLTLGAQIDAPPALGLGLLVVATGLLLTMTLRGTDPLRLPWLGVAIGAGALLAVAAAIQPTAPRTALAYAAVGVTLAALMILRSLDRTVRASGLVLALGAALIAQGLFFRIAGATPLVGMFRDEPWYPLGLSVALIVTGLWVLVAEVRLRGRALALPGIAAIVLTLTLLSQAVLTGSWAAVALHGSLAIFMVMTLWLRLPLTVGSRIVSAFGIVLLSVMALGWSLSLAGSHSEELAQRSSFLSALAPHPGVLEAQVATAIASERHAIATRTVAVGGTIAILALAATMAVVLTRSIGLRTRQLQAAASSIASDHAEGPRLQLREGGDDLDELARSFELMRERISVLAKAEAHRSAELASVLEAVTGQAVIGTDPLGVITSWSRGAELMLGWNASEMIGEESPSLLFHDRDELAAYAKGLGGGPQFETFVATTRVEPAVVQYWTYRHKDGRRFPVEVGVTARRGASGEVIGFLGVARDLTGQHEHEAALVAARVAAEQTDRAKSSFLADMSHELRTPLNAILGFSDLLTEQLDPTLSPAHRRFLSNIHVAGVHLLGLIDDVLDLSKVESGRLDLSPEQIDLADLLEPPLVAARAQAEQAGLGFDVARAATGPVSMDVRLTRQVLFNLLSNAIKFTPAPGKVTLGLSFEERSLVITVADSGIGIPPEETSKVFGVFERVNRARSSASGTGLGLALTKRIIDLQGGTIGFKSAVGVGTTFTVVVPNVRSAGPDGALGVAA